MPIWKLLIISALALCSSVVAQDPNFHIYLAFGQSNMVGAGGIQAEDLEGIDSRFLNLSGVTCEDRSIGVWRAAIPPLCNCTSHISVADYFGRTMVENLPDSIRIGVAIVGVSGSKIGIFDKEDYKTYTANPPDWMVSFLTDYNGYPYQRLVELGRQAKKDGVINGILLHQGESNDGDGDTWLYQVQKIYQDLLADLQLDASQVPLLAGEVAGKDEGGLAWNQNYTIIKLPQVIPTAHVVLSSDLYPCEDGLHFTTASYRLFGARYANLMLELEGHTPKNGTSAIGNLSRPGIKHLLREIPYYDLLGRCQ